MIMKRDQTRTIIITFIRRMCDRASCMKLTRSTNLMRQLWFIIKNYLYIFRASICPSSGVQVVWYCIWCSALGVVAVVPRSRCLVLCTVCRFVYRCPKHVEIIFDNKSQLLHQVGTSCQCQNLFLCKRIICGQFLKILWRNTTSMKIIFVIIILPLLLISKIHITT
jgi:hypothetical protein